MTLVAGVDCSTQATKVAVVDTDNGEMIGQGAAPHTVTGAGGARETDPRNWEDALAAALAATGRAADLRAVSVAGQQHGLVVVDRTGEPLRPAILWNDTRSAGDADDLVDALGGPAATARRLGSVPTAAFTVTSWAWLRRTEPNVAAAAASVRLPHDHLVAALVGSPTTDRSDVSGTGWWSPVGEDYAADVLSLPTVDLDAGLLPTVLGPEEPAGLVAAAARDRFGLARGTVVACGAGDNASAALALALRPGEIALSLGTSGTTFAVASHPSADPSGVVAGFAGADGRYLPLACTLNATLAVDRVASWLGIERQAVEPSAGVVCLPWLDGERTPNFPQASGSLWGLRHDTPRGAILQAAYEGVVATLLDAAGRLDAWTHTDRQAPLILIGGGARGEPWRQTVRRLSGRPVLVPASTELAAYGAAVQAAAVLTDQSVRDVAAAWGARTGTMFDPVPADRLALDRIAAWRQLVAAHTGQTRPEPEV